MEIEESDLVDDQADGADDEKLLKPLGKRPEPYRRLRPCVNGDHPPVLLLAQRASPASPVAKTQFWIKSRPNKERNSVFRPCSDVVERALAARTVRFGP